MGNSTRLISLTFDDALNVHLDRVIPALDSRGLHGTFFVTLGAPSFTARLDAWRRAAAGGHELGNHTIHHPAWRRKSYVTEGNAIENYTLDRMRTELAAANRILDGLDGQTVRTFAYPCSNPVLGRPGILKLLLRACALDRTRLMGWLQTFAGLDIGSTERSYEPVVAELFAAARIGGERFSAGTGYPPRRSAVPCVSLDGKSRGDVTAVLDAFMTCERGWLVFMAHGIGGGHALSVEADVFEWLLDALRERSVTVCTFREGALALYGSARA